MENGGNGTPLIRMEGVKKVFFTEEMETHALADIHLEIHDGEFAEVMGPSGCGKSTLLSLVGLLDTPTEGGYWLDGEDVANTLQPDAVDFWLRDAQIQRLVVTRRE